MYGTIHYEANQARNRELLRRADERRRDRAGVGFQLPSRRFRLVARSPRRVPAPARGAARA